jgi:hypothetical protein
MLHVPKISPTNEHHKGKNTNNTMQLESLNELLSLITIKKTKQLKLKLS